MPPCCRGGQGPVRGQTVLVDGFLAPCWSWRGIPDLWSGKHKETGFNSQLIANLAGDVIFISEPLTGHNDDMTVLSKTETAEIMSAAFSGIADKVYQGSGYITPIKKPQHPELRAPVERAIAHVKSWRILHTDYRSPTGGHSAPMSHHSKPPSACTSSNLLLNNLPGSPAYSGIGSDSPDSPSVPAAETYPAHLRGRNR